MKRIILVCSVLALLGPAYVFAADGAGSGLALDQMWQSQQADHRQQESAFKAADAVASKAAAPVAKRTSVRKHSPATSK